MSSILRVCPLFSVSISTWGQPTVISVATHLQFPSASPCILTSPTSCSLQQPQEAKLINHLRVCLKHIKDKRLRIKAKFSLYGLLHFLAPIYLPLNLVVLDPASLFSLLMSFITSGNSSVTISPMVVPILFFPFLTSWISIRHMLGLLIPFYMSLSCSLTVCSSAKFWIISSNISFNSLLLFTALLCLRTHWVFHLNINNFYF